MTSGAESRSKSRTNRPGPRIPAWAVLLGGLVLSAAEAAPPAPKAEEGAGASPSLHPGTEAADSAASDSTSVSPADSIRAVRPPRAGRPDRSAPARSRFPGAPLLLYLPLAEWPHSFDSEDGSSGPASPSMRQSLLWNAGATQLGVQSLAWAWEGSGWPYLVRDIGLWVSLGAFSYLFTYLPPGEAWMHEEWHRAVLERRGAESHNGVYDFEIGAGIIKVDGVLDEDLERIKRDHPADFIRLMAAGYEAEVESHRLMRRNNFFLGRPSRHDRIIWWAGGLNATVYLAACAEGWFDGEIEDMEAEESSMADRDFTGPDFTAWVHDLRRPREPYAAEGGPRSRPHPSGTGGYRRYLASSDLTGDEKDYLRLQALLSLLNFSSPQLWGPDWLPGTWPGDGQGVLWNAGLAHHLTPFGYEIAGDLLVRRGKWAWTFTVQAYANADLALPGLSAELFRYPWAVGRKTLYLTGSASAWLQPDGLRFETGDALPGGAVLAGLAVPLAGGLEAWAEADGKTEGWVPGNVNLDPAVQARAGLAWRL